MATISINRIVRYRLSEDDAGAINRRRTTGASIAKRIREMIWPLGAQAHIGNDVAPDDIFPAIVVAVAAPGGAVASLQVFLDGNDTFWAQNRIEGITPGTWHWPPMQ